MVTEEPSDRAVGHLNEHRRQLPADLADRLVARISAEHPELSAGVPERILDQTLAFLKACVTATEPIGPSELVDIGWHTFILYTREYAEFCERIAGRFIHHVPDDEPTGDEWPTVPKANLAVTVAAIRRAGYMVDAKLWSMTTSADCTQCHAGCHDSPTR
ncbi:glycine-rich domain-containing protein [Actinoplanes sp. CA-142083]|uniref:glycine-rich domain-containing protein n=1 Tax=Actinoplanes sp. CA-142083 TaxID=3239903 RepID=UPI003D8C1FA9